MIGPAQISQCDERLMKIQVPIEFSRPVRSHQDLAYWKGIVGIRIFVIIIHHAYLLYLHVASEFRSWLLYYSLPVLHRILPDPYFTHYSLLVAAMHLLLSDVVTDAMLHKSEQYLNRFYGMFATLYGM